MRMIHLFPGPVSSCLTLSFLLFRPHCWWRLLGSSLLNISLSYAGQMTQWVKGQAGDLSTISGTHMVGGEPATTGGMHAPTQSINQQIKKKKILLSAPISFHNYFILCSWPVSDLLPSFYQRSLFILIHLLQLAVDCFGYPALNFAGICTTLRSL